MRAVLLDTGPIVGLLYRGDPHRKAAATAVRASAASGRSVCTIWEALGEAYTLIRMRIAPSRATEAIAVLRWAWESTVTILGAVEDDHHRAAGLLEQYPEQRMSYVDALVLAIAERHRIEEILTVDGTHFPIVRLETSPAITVI